MYVTDNKRSKEICKVHALVTCTSLSSIYTTGDRKLCVLELFKGNKEGIKENCQVEVLSSTVLSTSYQYI